MGLTVTAPAQEKGGVVMSKIGMCVNCLRDKMTIVRKDLCGTCDKAAGRLIGKARETALEEIRGKIGRGEGAYRFYATADFGDTWVKMATINSDAPPPVDISANQQINFSAVTYVRDKKGRPANITPGAPWQSDSRVNPPWET